MLINGFPIAGGGDIEMKYATGTSGATINVSGLDFKPQAIYVYGYMYNMQSYYAWVSLMFNGDELLSQVSGMSAGGLTVDNISVTDDGFTLTITDSRWSCTWHALGY